MASSRARTGRAISCGGWIDEIGMSTTSMPWTLQFATIPGLAILAVSLAFNLLGDGLRDVFDPRHGG